MNLRYHSTVSPADDRLSKVMGLAWSPNNLRLAAAYPERTITLYDENDQRRDKFGIKPSDPKRNSKNFCVTGLAFSPDSTKLAIAQSDSIVFVYKLGLHWGEKKSIVNKFVQTSPVTALVWPHNHQNDIVFGLADGKVRIGHLRSNKSESVYMAATPVVSICSSLDGGDCLVGHVDGLMATFPLGTGHDRRQSRFARHPCIPNTLCWAESIVCAGNNKQIIFYTTSGQVEQKFDYSHEEEEKEYSSACTSPSGQSVVVGSFNKFRVFSHSMQRNQWEEATVVKIPNFYTVSALSFRKDGSKLTAGSVCGAIENYDACIRRFVYQGKFEMTYVSPSQVIVKRLSTGQRTVLKSQFPVAITKIKVYHDQYIIAYTSDTILCGDLESHLVSEIPWVQNGREKFIFDVPKVCMIFNAGELTLISYGVNNEPLASVRTEHVSSRLISVKINEPRKSGVDGDSDFSSSYGSGVMGDENDCKKIAYLIDLQTVRIDSLEHGGTIATINHNAKIDWLEMNNRATKLLFRDKHWALNLFDIQTQLRTTLLPFCSYVQWVPSSDVVVAQNRGNICVWYSIESPERFTMLPVKGDVIDIERSEGKTEVVVDAGINLHYVSLDEALITFGDAIETRDFPRAVELLENMKLSPETEAMWQTLANLALIERKLKIAERCCAARGDVARTNYFHKLNKISDYAEREMGLADGTEFFMVRAKLEVLEKQFHKAEYIFLEQGQVEEATSMYQELHKWDEAIAVAEAKNLPEVDEMRSNYFQWLLDSHQEEKAAQLREKDGNYHEAIRLYLKGGLPARAAHLVSRHGMMDEKSLLEEIAMALFKAALFERAGDFFEQLQMIDRALDAYRRGKAYRSAVDVCRRHYPKKVVPLEEEWGEYLVSQKQTDAAIHHFIEAGKYVRALDAALDSRQWEKAVQIVDNLDAEQAKVYFKRIAKHYEETGTFDRAEEYFRKAGLPQEAVDMYTKNNMWTNAHDIAITFMTDEEVSQLYVTQALRMENQGRLKEAESLLLTVNEPDTAINMYKKKRQYDDMIRLVTKYHKDLLKDTHFHLAQQLEGEGQFKPAEKHFILAQSWKHAVNMYRMNNQWEEAMRVARQISGVKAAGQVAMVRAKSLGGEAGVNFLMKSGFSDLAIDFALDNVLFRKAEEVAREHAKRKLPDIYLQHGNFLEDEGRFQEAEEEFVRAQKPTEGVFMYLHQKDWLNATRMAESFCPESMPDILEAQGTSALEAKDYNRAQDFFLRAKKPQLAVEMWKSLGMHENARALSKDYTLQRPSGKQINAPASISDIPGLPSEASGAPHSGGVNQESNEAGLSAGQNFEKRGEFVRAVDEYLKISPQDSQILQNYVADPTKCPDAELKQVQQMTQNWLNSVKIVCKHVPEREDDVITLVLQRLQEVQFFTEACDLLIRLDRHKEALEIYVRAGMYEEAQKLSQEKFPDYRGAVVEAELEALAKQGLWKECIDKARGISPELLAKYVGFYAKLLLEKNEITQAARTFTEYSAPPIPENKEIYEYIAGVILDSTEAEENPEAVRDLKEMMMQLVEDLNAASGFTEEDIQFFERLNMAVFLLDSFYTLKETSLTDIAAKISLSLLRYGDLLPVDKLFYLSGTACTKAGNSSVAFLLLNRYLDVSEALEDETPADLIPNMQFAGTDVPEELPLPKEQFLCEERREEVRNWLLTQSLNADLDPDLPVSPCQQCETEIYSASTWCCECNEKYETCIIGGYPVRTEKQVTCDGCGKHANREDWNKYIGLKHACPWCGQTQNESW